MSSQKGGREKKGGRGKEGIEISFLAVANLWKLCT